MLQSETTRWVAVCCLQITIALTFTCLTSKEYDEGLLREEARKAREAQKAHTSAARFSVIIFNRKYVPDMCIFVQNLAAGSAQTSCELSKSSSETDIYACFC